MRLDKINAFLTIYKCGSMSAAAEAMFLTQPALSKRIRSLEEELGCSLLVRGKGIKQVELTAEGEAFVHVAERWKLLWEETEKITMLSPANTLRVSSIDSVATTLLPQVYMTFLEQNPGRNLLFSSTHSLPGYDRIADNSTDLAFVTYTKHSSLVTTVPFFSEPLYVVSGKDYISGGVVHPGDLPVSDEIYKTWNAEFEQWHRFWFNTGSHPRITCDHISIIKALLEERNTFCIMPLTIAQWTVQGTSLIVQPLGENPPCRTLYYLIPADNHGKERELTLSFLEIFRNQLCKINGITLF